MRVGDVLSEAFGLYTRFFWRFVGTSVVVFAVLDLASAFADRASSDLASGLLWAAIALVLSIVGSFWLQGALVEAVADVRDGRIDTTRGYGWPVFGSLLVAFLAYVVVQGILRALFRPLPRFADLWIGGVVAHSVATPLIALTSAVLYFRLARLSVGVSATSPEASG